MGFRNKVLINPNFRPTIHVNPNFSQPPKRNIHVNPNILQKAPLQPVAPKVPQVSVAPKKASQLQEISQVTTSRFKFVKTVRRVPEENVVTRFKVERKTPLVKPAKGLESKNEFVKNLEVKVGVKKHKSQFKIVNVALRHTGRMIKSRYKLDKRLKVDCGLTKINQKVTLNKSLCVKALRNNKTALVRINGVLYRKSRNSLKKSVNVEANRTIVKTRFVFKRVSTTAAINKNPFKKVNKRKGVDLSSRKKKLSNNPLKIFDR